MNRRRRTAPAAIAALLAVALAGRAAAGVAIVHDAPLPPPDATATEVNKQLDYRIGPLDTLEITVFQVQYVDHPILVGADGHIGLPLIGDVAAAGKTPRELAADIAHLLGERYLQSPQVTVSVKTAVSQKFTVEGAVTKPGQFDVTGDTTLLKAVALAEGADQYANQKNVAVFRTAGNRRVGAVYDLAAINAGKADDPQIYAGDIVVVGTSAMRRFIRDFAPITPFFTLFRPF
ncbi:MAG TPA: polysaccharide biosynthesis/export family protein [Caulobacteraceae bacterium]|jgi:polysaccharide export outer membrane protein|nr:polysaccharide biosynthesis/export family protein [Caulobacteraceae bacterium]